MIGGNAAEQLDERPENSRVVRLPRPHAGARHVLAMHNADDGKDTTVLVGGRKWYKTSNIHLIRYVRLLLEGGQFLHLAPTYEQAMECYGMFAKINERAGSEIFKLNKADREVRFRRALGQFRSLDKAENLRSKNAPHIGIDEIQSVKKDDFERVILPITLNFDLNLVMTGTANGYDWVDEFGTKAANEGTAHYWRLPTKGYRWVGGKIVPEPHPYENDRLPFERVARLAAVMTQSNVDQEFGAKKVTPEGMPFSAFNRQRHVKEVEYRPGVPLTIGLDFGYRVSAVQVRQWIPDPSDPKGMGTLHVLWDAEYYGRTTDQMIDAMMEEPWWQFVNGDTLMGVDPAGQNRNTQTGLRDVQVLRKRLPCRVIYSNKPELRSPKFRMERMQDWLQTADGETHIKIHPRCTHTITMKERTRYPKATSIEDKPGYPLKAVPEEHMRDAMGYGNNVKFYLTRGQWLDKRLV